MEKIHLTRMVPDYAESDFYRGDYDAWLVGHTDPAQLTRRVLNAHMQTAHDVRAITDDDINDDSAMGPFEDYLKMQGYIVFHDEGTVILDVPIVGELDLEDDEDEG